MRYSRPPLLEGLLAIGGGSGWSEESQVQLSSEERLFLVETIHTILSKQNDSDRTPSALASRPSPLHPIQPLSHSPLFFSASIFDLDDASLTDCLGQLAQLAEQDQTSNHCELSQSFVDGLVSCLGSSNKILSNCARLVLTRKLPLFFRFLLSHIDSLAKTLSNGTYDERTFAIQLVGRAVEAGITPKWVTEALIHQICRTKFGDPQAFINALIILKVPERLKIFEPHSPSVVESFEVLVTSSIDVVAFVRREYSSILQSNHALRNMCLSLVVFRHFASSRRNCWSRSEVVELLFRPDFSQLELQFLNYTPNLLIQTFPFELMIERMIRSCQFVDVLRGLIKWVQLVTQHHHPFRDLFSTLHPFFIRGFHQILLSPPPHSSPDARVTYEWYAVGQELFRVLAKSGFDSLLPHLFPVENLLSLRAQILTANRQNGNLLVSDMSLFSFPSFTPFGECPALSSIFSVICEHGVRWNINILIHIAVVSSHSIPLNFDSPLLAFVQALHPLPRTTHEEIRFVLNWLKPFRLKASLQNLLSLSPIRVSLALLTLSRAVDVSPKACQWLVYRNAVDVVVESVCRSRFLEDYEHGCAIICALLRACGEKTRQTRVAEFNFFPLLINPLQGMI
ncbi:hypothetical protein BLNAU_20273 [Blattamonas nauphoetae]|uniref:Adaptor-related protein complex 5 beta subunit n=1 Tax=Blattamonas nauphoetae TaxID=2049346 RepID=A0ABQ9X3C4_9EUKA|nr:hypothetical protein BLNAU_20273 [Blattamonas nauphoetae]